MNFFKIFQHLLPNSHSWNLTQNKNLTRFFEGFSGIGTDVKTFVDSVYDDISPQTTTQLEQWESQFALPDTLTEEQKRRDRLDASWKALGGQDPRYIQDTLQNNGFPVFLHKWWVPGTQPPPGIKQCVVPRNPLLVIRSEFTEVLLLVECGEGEAQCGEAFAECGNSKNPLGYPLVNKVFETEKDLFVLCGEELAACGEEQATCANFVGFKESVRDYIVPIDPEKWPYFLYIGGEIFPELAQIPNTRRDEFEDLCLKICPTQLWLGILVEYT